MSVAATRILPGLLCLALLATPCGRADTVVLAGKPPFRNVQILNFKHGRLYFRGVSGEVLKKPLGEVSRFEIDRCPALSSAESLGGTDAGAAIAAYENGLREAGEPWVQTLIRARLLGAYDRAGHFDDAVVLYIRLAPEQPELADACAPRHPAPPGSERNRRAREQLLAAIRSAGPRPVPPTLRTLALELLLFDEVAPLPRELAPPASQPASGLTSQPGTPPPLLFGDDRRRASQPLYLPGESFVFTGVRQALDEADAARATRLLERSRPYVAKRDSPRWGVLMGRCLIELGQPARAADELLALVETIDEGPVADEALYYVGVAHERMGRTDVAARIYRKLMQQDDLSAKTRELALQGLKRLGE
jgi:tetratricopeptide (TPR) repeat protein